MRFKPVTKFAIELDQIDNGFTIANYSGQSVQHVYASDLESALEVITHMYKQTQKRKK